MDIFLKRSQPKIDLQNCLGNSYAFTKTNGFSPESSEMGSDI
ncbi:hypothetical protein J2X97_002794 [Epilithonimonas hungarica]|nr:hypothetical protein [Epilithonimonas hungarica]